MAETVLVSPRSQSMSVTQEQAATIRQYLNGIPGHVTIKTAMLGQGDVGKGRIILRVSSTTLGTLPRYVAYRAKDYAISSMGTTGWA